MNQTFVVLGDVKGQPRPRTGKVCGHAIVYESKEGRQNKANIRAQVVQQGPELIEKGKPVCLTVEAHMPRPQAHYGKNGLKDWAPVYHTGRPDSDNIMKAVKDSLKGVCWYDDAQVADERTIKIYGDAPKMIITVGVL